ncbi:hypothetical protein [Paracoccus sulfuroxidans]|uniref:Uncharacterized protein n=1 Tax=Paracoccus sulfuroxidans TaxID=384678 RepID=A0A562NSL1_9RHOB|nr:hypothetical protein [Paracoccus sulfuroxidans]TWI35197.1 hypothetical protein IQ24_01707 [Paracoccus sulfuroxidans]
MWKQRFIGIYWTRPVPWAGFTEISPDVDVAITQSRTIHYQCDVIRRYVKEVGGELESEVSLLELAPDRATPESALSLRKVVTTASPEALFLSVEFSATRGWRPHPFIRDGLPSHRTLGLPPDPILMDGKLFDPADHFAKWRATEKGHVDSKSAHRDTVLDALRPQSSRSYQQLATDLNAKNLKTHGGKDWTADNLRKFLGANWRGTS